LRSIFSFAAEPNETQLNVPDAELHAFGVFMQAKLTIIIAKEKSDYIAYCNELGIASRGRTPAEAKAGVEAAIYAYLEETGVTPRKHEQLN